MNIKSIIDVLSFEDNCSVSGVNSSATVYLISQLLNNYNNIFIVVPDESSANLFKDGICAFKDVGCELFPAYDVIPYVGLNPDSDIVSARLDLLNRIIKNPPKIVVSDISALLHKLPPPVFIRNSIVEIKLGDVLDYKTFIEELVDLGFESAPIVEDIGTFAKRGGVIDVWPTGFTAPIRMELDGDNVVSIRKFDPANQRSTSNIDDVKLLPAMEFNFDESSRSQAKIRLQKISKSLSPVLRRQVIAQLNDGRRFDGIQTFLPIFYDKISTILDYLPADTLFVWYDPQGSSFKASALSEKLKDSFDNCPGYESLIKPEHVFSKINCLRENSFKKLDIYPMPEPGIDNVGLASVPNFKSWPHDERWEKLTQFAKEKDESGTKMILSCSSSNQRDRFFEIIKTRNSLELFKDFIVGKFETGFVWPDEECALITDADIVDTAPLTKPLEQVSSISVTSLAELDEGDYVVHDRHGIGQLKGLMHLNLGKIWGDYLLIEYRDKDKLYLPADRLSLIEKYSSPGNQNPVLDKLGGGRWERVKTKAKKIIEEIAFELVQLYAARKALPGISFDPIDQSYEDFCASFPFDETPDQRSAIESIMDDMDKEKAMDRLICGDVGFGKTEVALRGAYRAAMSGKQVALIVPTTVLALQHFQTFKQRFASFPVRVAMLSRFCTRKEVKKTIEEIAKGTVDIVIGTHRLFQKDIIFSRLGVLIIDEEHRFGVKHKEKIRELKNTVDTITLTATPIPRTLYMSLIGVRDVSLITSPPSKRQAISTYVANFDDILIKRAILTEIDRNGQVFFVHNRVKTIHSIYDHLKKLLPDIKIVIGHGQMKTAELEQAMMEFIEGKADVLLCTAIIESGLDIPNANTIIIDRADMFGLAELYQLRGRVGRSDRHAYAYLLKTKSGKISNIAEKRLSALVRYTALGSGFQIAMHDLELRGAGNILGTAQSGHIEAIGYEMYTKILGKAISQIKGEKVLEDIDPELKLGVEAYLPEDYVPESHNRVVLYRRLSSVKNEKELKEIVEEIEDRFGSPPVEVYKLFDVMKIKMIARYLFIDEIIADNNSISVTFNKNSKIDVKQITKLIEKDPYKYQLTPKALVIWGKFEQENRLEQIQSTLTKNFDYKC